MSEALPGEHIEDKSVGALVAMASKNISNLIRAEMDLAKMELKADAKKAAISSVMFTIAAVMGGLVVIMLSIALAYGMVALGLPHWLAFLLVAVLYALLAVLLMYIAKRLIQRIEGAKRTRRTLKDDIATLRRRGDSDAPELTA
ncbi:putative superfamily III holin-X [Actinomadura hallensis]|uniref:Putative superfamily III holin-X n=1 Tax=Actinomadura hallensis TaxID=337895 RepID=A0A543INE4_9ACTN|nr:phage holin family protein [Actinomadura hallensis]TQM72112.1 putative superfamily III holin-X [Actinomadura hallensis]